MSILVAMLATGFVLVRFTPVGDYFTRDNVIATFERLAGWPGSPVLLILLYGVLAPMGLPMSPLVLAGAVVFGALWGSFYNTAGLVFGAMTAFYVARFLGRDFILHLVGPRLRRAERIFERRGFWTLVQARFVPVPFPSVSYGAAFAGVKAPRFLVTSTLGLIPATVMHTYFMARIYDQTVVQGASAARAEGGGVSPVATTLALYFGIWGAMILVTGWPTLREGLRRRQRYRELREQREARDSTAR